MSNRTAMNFQEKSWAIWLGVSAISVIALLLTGYKLPETWLWVWGFITLYFVEEMWNKRTDDLKRRVEKLEERINDLEKRT
jgi:hypothetical protein